MSAPGFRSVRFRFLRAWLALGRCTFRSCTREFLYS